MARSSIGSNLSRSPADRLLLAEYRLGRVLKTYTVASMRTLENKISDGGPADMRIDPHILTTARNKMINEGLIKSVTREGAPWYTLLQQTLRFSQIALPN